MLAVVTTGRAISAISILHCAALVFIHIIEVTVIMAGKFAVQTGRGFVPCVGFNQLCVFNIVGVVFLPQSYVSLRLDIMRQSSDLLLLRK